jgi:hypothetical protein
MQAPVNELIGGRTAGGFGLSLLGLVGTLSATIATLLIWTLLTAPTEVAVAVASGPSALAGALVRVVFDAVRRLLSWF